MKRDDFWPLVWSIETMLDGGPTAVDDDLMNKLKQNEIQAFVFGWRKNISPDWLATFREHGLFETPPDVIKTKQGLSTRAWPVMTYLEGTVDAQPQGVAEILLSLDTNNWWAISDAMKVAIRLPDQSARQVIPHLISLWASAPAQWARDDLLAELLARLGQASLQSEFVLQCAEIVFATFSGSMSRNSSSRIVNELEGRVDPSLHGAIASGIEVALRVQYGSSEEIPLPRLEFGPRRRRRRSHDLLTDLVSDWYGLAGKEVEVDRSAALLRCEELLSSRNHLFVGMGLAVARLLLSGEVSEELLKEVVRRVVTDPMYITSPFLTQIAGEVVAAGWGLVDAQAHQDSLDTLMHLAASAEIRDKYFAHEWLHLLRAHLDGSYARVLEALDEELGEVRKIKGLSIGDMWVGPESPLDEDALDTISPKDLAPYLQYVPGPQKNAWAGPSPEGLAWQLPRIIGKRFEEFAPHLEALASQIKYLSLVTGFIQAVAEGLRTHDPDEEQVKVALDVVLRLVNRVDTDEFVIDAHGIVDSRSHVISAAVDLVELNGERLWPLTTNESVPLQIIERALADVDPTPESEQEFGGSNMDPPTFALNCTRGKGIRALFTLMELGWKEDPRQTLAHLRSLLESFILGEKSSSVRSVLGEYLPRIAYYEPDLWKSLAPRILPKPEDPEHWEAVFVTYLLYNSVYRPFVSETYDHYELATERLTDQFPFLLGNAERLLTHEMVLMINPGDDAERWRSLFLAGLAKASIEAVGQTFWELERAYETKSVTPEAGWLLSFLREVVPVLRNRGEEAEPALSHLANSVLVSGLVASAVGTALVDLIRQGGKPDGRRLFLYLTSIEDEPSRTGGLILSTAVGMGSIDPFEVSDEELEELIDRYSAVAPSEMQETVNNLGWSGRFGIEPAARKLLS
jgi:hypothetical protein